MRAGDLILYDYDGSPCARRVRMTLFEKRLPWRTQLVDLSRLEQRSERYLAINPNGLVPTLAHGPRVVWESNVVTEYLDDAFPERRLYPVDPWAKLAVKEWQAAELAMAKHFRPLMYQRLLGPVMRASHTLDEVLAIARRSTDDPADLEWERRVWSLSVLSGDEARAAEAALVAFLDRLESALEGREWLVGGGFTQAEISVYPRVRMFPHVGVAVSPARHPRVARWCARLEGRPCFPATVSRKEAAIARFASSPLLTALRHLLAKPASDRSALDRAALAALGRAIRLAMRDRVRSGRAPFLAPPRDVAPPPSRARALAGTGRCRVVLRTSPGSMEGAALRVALLARGVDHEVAPGDATRVAFDARIVEDAASAAELVDELPSSKPRLFPEDAWGAAQARMWIAFDAAMHKELRALRSTATVEAARASIGRRYDRLDAHLRGRRFVASDRLTFADVWLAARVVWLRSADVAVDRGRPNVERWHHDVLGRPFVARVLGAPGAPLPADT